jgi:hypothetical protein
MVSVPCWQMNAKCGVKGLPKEESHCPVYMSGRSCYEFDWASFIKDLPADDKMYWKVHLGKCKNCHVYKVYKKDMDKVLAEVKKV